MAGESSFKEEKVYTGMLACGRTFDEQIASIEAQGSHGSSSVLRNAVLAAHGIVNPKKSAPNGIFFGCYRPFTTPFLLRDYLRLLDLLGVEYTWFDREYCCGWPLAVSAPDGAAQRVIEAAGAFIRKNSALADGKGASTLAYCCVGCAHAARHWGKEPPEKHVFILDLVCDAMEKRKSRIVPMTVGYFEGCHVFNRASFPGTTVDWPRYRRLLNSVDGLTVVDIPSTSCCKRAADKILENARQLKAESVVCPCNGCYRSLQAKAPEGLRMLTMPELLLKCFEKGN